MNLLLQSNHNNIENPFLFKKRSDAIIDEDFRSINSLNENGWISNNITIIDSVGYFDGTSSRMSHIGLSGTYSIRIKLSSHDFSNLSLIFDNRGNGSGTGFLYVDNGNLYSSSGIIYVDSLQTTIVTSNSHEIVVSGIEMTTDGGTFKVGCRYANDYSSEMGVSLFQVYDRNLTSSEIINFYTDNYYDKIDQLPIIDFASYTGVIRDYSKNNTLTLIDMNVLKDGEYWWPNFNGNSSKIECGDDFIETNQGTAIVWVKLRNWGESGGIRSDLLTNGKYSLYVDSRTIRLTRNYLDITRSDINKLETDKWYYIAVTSDNGGITNFFVGDLKNAPTLTGLTDQNAGTPVAGITNAVIGNNSAQSRSLDGIFSLKYFNTILTITKITQEWSSTKWRIQPYSGYDNDAILYIRKVYEDGGVVIDASAVNDFIVKMKKTKAWATIKMAYAVCWGVKLDASNYVSKLYDIKGNNDAIQNTGVEQILSSNDWLVGNGVRNLEFGVPSLPATYHARMRVTGSRAILLLNSAGRYSAVVEDIETEGNGIAGNDDTFINNTSIGVSFTRAYLKSLLSTDINVVTQTRCQFTGWTGIQLLGYSATYSYSDISHLVFSDDTHRQDIDTYLLNLEG